MAQPIPTFDAMRAAYIAWFQDEYGVPPVITSSTGLPAVHFALHALKRFGLQEVSSEGADEP